MHKRHFAYEAPDEPMHNTIKRLEVSYFNVVRDDSTQSLEDSLHSVGNVRDNFGVLLSFSDFDAETLSDQCNMLEDILTCGQESNIDDSALATGIENLPKSFSGKENLI